MAREPNRLTATEVTKIKEPGRYRAGRNLYLQAAEWHSKDGPKITKSWLFRYTFDGKARQMGLGSIDDFTLKEARERARQARQLLADGVDPLAEKERRKAERRAEASKRIKFKEAAEKYIASHRSGWKSPKHADQWSATLETYAYPVVGGMDVADVDTGHIMRVLEPIWTTKSETASRLRGRMEKVLAWAAVRGYREGANPAVWRGHLDALLPNRSKVQKVRHMEAADYRDVPAIMARLREMDAISASALRFTILTAARTNEIIGATWGEIDFKERVWTIPASRMKADREHTVPLSEGAIEMLQSLHDEAENDYVFIGARKGRGLSNMAMLKLLKGMEGCDSLTVHGFRSSFRDWAGEQSNFPREVCEHALAHQLKDKAEAAYQRGSMLEKRRQLMAAWDRYCASPVIEGEKVVPIRGGKA